jgi:hypothetical protein
MASASLVRPLVSQVELYVTRSLRISTCRADVCTIDPRTEDREDSVALTSVNQLPPIPPRSQKSGCSPLVSFVGFDFLRSLASGSPYRELTMTARETIPVLRSGVAVSLNRSPFAQ